MLFDHYDIIAFSFCFLHNNMFFCFQYYEMSYGLNVEMHKQVNIKSHLFSFFNKLFSLISQFKGFVQGLRNGTGKLPKIQRTILTLTTGNQTNIDHNREPCRSTFTTCRSTFTTWNQTHLHNKEPDPPSQHGTRSTFTTWNHLTTFTTRNQTHLHNRELNPSTYKQS